MLSDLRYAVRSLARSYGFALTVVATLALGIGAAASVFSLTYWLLFHSDPWPDRSRLFVIGSNAATVSLSDSGVRISPFLTSLQFQACREQTDVFTAFAASQLDAVNVAVAGAPVRASVRRVSADFLPTLGIAPALGRGFLPEDFRPDAANVALITHQFWQDHLGGVPEVLGRDIEVDQQPFKIIGVLPKNQVLPIFSYGDVLRPLIPRVDPARPRGNLLTVIGHLKPGVTPAQARAELKAVKIVLSPQRQRSAAEQELSLIPLAELKKIYRPEVYWTLVGAVGFLYAIACLNAANLMLVRVLGQRRELSIRLALGGGRWRIVRLILVESVLLSLLACAGGTLITHWIFPILVRVTAGAADMGVSGVLNWRVLGVMGGLTMLTSLLVAAIPAGRVIHAEIPAGLRDGGSALGENAPLARMRAALVILQAALAVILLAGAALMSRTLGRLQQVDLGYDPTSRFWVQFTIPVGYRAEREDRLRLFQQLQQRLRAIPGVREVAFSSNALPGGHTGGPTQVRLRDGSDLNIARDDVSYDYLRAAGLTLRQGQWLPEVRDNGKQVVINESLAKKVFGDQDPIGQQIDVVRDGKVDPWLVIGVVKDIRGTPRSAAEPQVYCSDWWWPPNLSTFVLRLAREPGPEFEGLVRRAMYDSDPRLYVWNVLPLDKAIEYSMRMERLTRSILGALSGIALALAVVGLFSVLAYTVDRRMAEFGLRLALGAPPADLARMVLRRGLTLTAIGVGTGVAGALGLTRFLRSLLFETTAYEPGAYLLVAALLLGAAVAACWLPARRAARADVASLLRRE